MCHLASAPVFNRRIADTKPPGFDSRWFEIYQWGRLGSHVPLLLEWYRDPTQKDCCSYGEALTAAIHFGAEPPFKNGIHQFTRETYFLAVNPL